MPPIMNMPASARVSLDFLRYQPSTMTICITYTAEFPQSDFQVPNISAARDPLVTNNVVSIANRQYLARPKISIPYGRVDPTQDTFKPTLLLSRGSTPFTAQTILDKVKEFDVQDDVFCVDFLSDTVLLQSPPLQDSEIYDLKKRFEDTKALGLRSWKVRSIIFVNCCGRDALPPGPYFLHCNQICEAWRLYEDHLEAFQSCLVPDSQDPYRFDTLNSVSPNGLWKSLAVPSRLYSLPTSEKPLAGVRIAVKDIYKVDGVQASLNVRSWLATYGPHKETSTYVKKLIDLGAVVVGKSKTAALGGSEKAPEYWVDFQCPFNPRADGYQVPSGSTSGGAACLAGYEWLDLSLGTDTYGSIRAPASSNGLYGLRCTVDEAASMENIYAQCKEFDTVGVLSRDLAQFYNFGHLSFHDTLPHEITLPEKILCPQDWDHKWTPEHHAVKDKAIEALEDFLGVKREILKFSDVWDTDPHPRADGRDFQSFFRKTGYNIFYHDAYHQWDQFRKDHLNKFGTNPAVGPHTRFCWDLGAAIAPEERERATEELQIYREWMADHFLTTPSGGSTIIVIPQGSTIPDYRDEMTEGMNPRVGPDPNSWGAWLGIPQLVLPVENCAYASRVSGVKEHLPACVSFLGPKGSDLSLIKVAHDAFENAGLPTKLKVGKTIT